jgi:hypothetical protein
MGKAHPERSTPVDLAAWLVLIAFEGIIGGVAVLLSLTYVSFTRMEREVRRARMFIMADRIKRFLGAFTLGFVVLAVAFAGTFIGLVIPAAVIGGAFFFFLGTIAYGIIELFFIVRPRQAVHAPNKGGRIVPRHGMRPMTPQTEQAEEEGDATG